MTILLTASNIIPVAEHMFACPALNLEINDTSIISMIGPQSSSKSIWLKTLTGFNAMAQGELTILQHDIRKINRQQWLNLQKDISYVGEDSALLSALTLMENILLPALYHKMGEREDLINRAYSLLNQLGFDDREELNKLPAFVAPLLILYTRLVRALIVRPKILFMADVYSNISPGRIYNIKKFIKSHVDKTGMSVILTSSYLQHVIDDSNVFIFLSKNEAGVYSNRQDLLKSDASSVKAYLSENHIQ